MDLPTSVDETESASLAPALARGIRLLERLDMEGPCTLSFLADRLAIPVATVHRLLKELESLGCVERQGDRRFRSLKRLVSAENPDENFMLRLEKTLETLSLEANATAEWYEAKDGNLFLAKQQVGRGELQVRAKPGFVRDMSKELEAVSTIGYAFWKSAPKVRPGICRYVVDGNLERIPVGVARRIVNEARIDGLAVDEFYNAHAVRRMAVPVFFKARFRGALSLAEAYRFQPDAFADKRQPLLLEAARSLNQIRK